MNHSTSNRANISTGPVSDADALRFAIELEAAIMEVANGARKPSKLPVEPMARLIQHARDTAAKHRALSVALDGFEGNAKECENLNFSAMPLNSVRGWLAIFRGIES